jgi:hypothetical protein
MANRAYLYSINKIPVKGSDTAGINIVGLSEHNWAVPIAFNVLVSGNPKICKSLIYEDENTGILGEYEKGLECLQKLLQLVRENNVQYTEVFERKCREAEEFLNGKKIKQKYFFLELGEIFIMEGEILNQPQDFLENNKYLRKLIDNRDFESLNRYNFGKDLRSHWEESLGLGYWSDILYFDFSRPKSSNE